MRENLEFREKMLERGRKNDTAAENLWIACKRDPLFWLATFGWTYEARNTMQPRLVPVLLAEYEGLVFDAIRQAIEGHFDLVVEKSRDMRVTWTVLRLFLWMAAFQPYTSFLAASRADALVDKAEDPDTLFWKLDFTLQHLPAFLRPQVERTNNHFYFRATKSTIDGRATTGDLSAGGRRLAIFLDEAARMPHFKDILAATADVTDSRLFISTAQAGHPFRELAQSDIAKLRLLWTLSPAKGAGLYTSKDGVPILLDTKYPFPREYPFIVRSTERIEHHDGKLRSPWYDKQCRRRKSKKEVAQEIDIDYLAAGSQFFDQEVLDRMMMESVRPPLHRGRLHYDAQTLEPKYWIEDERGPLCLWFHPDGRGLPPADG